MKQHTNTPYVQRIQVQVPPETKWEPQRVQRFIDNLFTRRDRVTLSIRATTQDITWWIEVGKPAVDAVVSSLYTLHSDAQINVVPKNGIDAGYYVFYVESAGPYIGPILSASDAKQDPLSWIVGSMTHMGEDEELVYELTLSPPRTNYRQLGERLMTKSNVSWFEFTSLEGAVGASVRKGIGGDKTSRYTTDIEKVVFPKLAAQLMEVTFVIKAKARSRKRADEFVDPMFAQLSTFDVAGFGLLYSADEDTYPLVLSASEVAALWHPPTADIATPGVSWAMGVMAPAPLELTRSAEEGIVLGTNTHRGQTHRITLADVDRVTHINIIGRTRLGKSTLFHNMLHQDIMQGKGVGVIDPHGDLFKEVLTSIPEHRHKDVVIFDVTDTEYPVGLNLFSHQTGVRAEDEASEILGVIRRIFAANWNPTRMEDVMYSSIAALIEYGNATIQDIPKLLSNSEFRGQVLAKVKDRVTKEFWVDEYEPLSPGQKLETARPINSRLRRFYRNETIQRILCQQSSLDFRQLMDGNKIFLANLGGLRDAEREVMGALLISKIQMAAMSRGELAKAKRSMFYLYIDEVQNFVTTSLPVIFSEAAKYGLSLVTANQFLKQLEGSTLDAIMGNVGTTVIFGVGPDDARILERFVKPTADSTALIKQDRGQTVVRMMLDGKALDAFSMITLPPLDISEADPETIAHLREQSRAKYARHRDDVDNELDERFATADNPNEEEASDEGPINVNKFAD